MKDFKTILIAMIWSLFVILLVAVEAILSHNKIDEVAQSKKPLIESAVKTVVIDSVVADPETRVIATVYNAVPAQCNNDPGHTASMFKLDLGNPYRHKIIAVSRDLLKEFPYGTKVKVSGTSYDGIYTVEDTMNRRYTNRIDILINLDMPIGKWNKASIIKIN